MSVMELAEVVNPHFAVPVVGVVLCAVLVFAFGFKSSVQPPSFDFEKDEKHRLRQKAHRKPKKPQSNGHVVTVEAPVTPVSKSTSPKPTSSPKSPPTEKAEGTQKSKVKKAPTSSKPKPEIQQTTKSAKEDDSAPGEWVPAKTRKRKQKKDDAKDGSDSAPEVDVKPDPKVEVTPEPKLKPEPKVEPKVEPKIEAKPEPKAEPKAEAISIPVTEAPLEKRVPKKDRKKKEMAEKAATPEPIPATAAPTTPEPTNKALAEPAKKATPEPTKKTTADPVKKTSPDPAKKTTPRPEAMSTAEFNVEDKTVTSPKRKSKKKAKAASPEPMPVKEPELTVKVITEVIPEVISEKVSDPIQAALEDAAADDDTLDIKMAIKSPKKNKKSKESRDKYQESLANAKLALEALFTSSASSGSTVSSPAAGEPSLASNTDSDIGRLKVTSPEGDGAASSSPSSDNSAPLAQTESTKAISFDELGDWQEAKPVKKRRKARRDN